MVKLSLILISGQLKEVPYQSTERVFTTITNSVHRQTAEGLSYMVMNRMNSLYNLEEDVEDDDTVIIDYFVSRISSSELGN